MEARVINVEHSSSGPNINQHYQQHFQQHYAATSETDLGNRFPVVTATSAFPTTNLAINNTYDTRLQTNSSRLPTPMSSFESHSQLIHSNTIDPSGSLRQQVEEKHEQQSKKTVQTTTTTTTTQPILVAEETITSHTPLNAPIVTTQAVEVVHHPNSCAGGYTNSCTNLVDPNAYSSIKVEHHPRSDSFSWTNADVYLHIFLTFYFGHFAAMLFFDGIIRNIVNLCLIGHSIISPFIFIVHIIFSIGFLAFTIWFMTICWRWWRYKSLVPVNGLSYFDHRQRPLRPKDYQAAAYCYVFIAACVLIIGFFIYLAIGLIDLSYKNQQKSHYSHIAFAADLIVYLFRLLFWLVGIIATLLLSREVLMKYCCPSQTIKIDKEKPTTVYEVRS